MYIVNIEGGDSNGGDSFIAKTESSIYEALKIIYPTDTKHTGFKDSAGTILITWYTYKETVEIVAFISEVY